MSFNVVYKFEGFECSLLQFNLQFPNSIAQKISQYFITPFRFVMLFKYSFFNIRSSLFKNPALAFFFFLQ
jgi:hypothetical protein